MVRNKKINKMALCSNGPRKPNKIKSKAENLSSAPKSIFDKFKEREEKEKVKNPIVKKNEKVEKLKEVFKGYLDWCSYTSLHLHQVYIKALGLIKEKIINCTSKDIEEFSLELVAFEDHKEFKDRAGLFLSALIESSKDKKFIIHTKHLKKKINYLGYEAKKNIVIEGGVGDWVGAYMREGSSIKVNGDAGYYVGAWMEKGSSIKVNGDAGHFVGAWMWEGSKIYLNGNYRFIGPDISPGGKIYHKGKLITDKN
jgi:formylmethanofuran dehydrogenase subunit C